MASDEGFLRLAIRLAWQARERGADPFGAVLVHNGTVVYQDYDRCVESSDPTYHVERAVISDYCQQNKVFALHGYTLYASMEPCPMCAGAIHWARISRLVFSVPQSELQARTGGGPKPSAESIANIGRHQVEVVGPLLLNEGLAALEGHNFVPKHVRHARRYGALPSE